MRITFSIALSLALSFEASAQQLSQLTDRYPARSLIEDFGTGLGAAESQSARPLMPLALDLIRGFEGWGPMAYNDPVGYCTIGYGHLIALKKCQFVDLGKFSATMSQSDGVKLLDSDTTSARLAVQTMVTADLTEEQFGALSSFVFNAGKSNFASSTLLKLVNANEFDLAASQFPRWVKAKGVILKGLVERRNCEESLFKGELEYSKSNIFDRANCGGLGAAPDVGPLIDVDVGE
jgi:lysozyme